MRLTLSGNSLSQPVPKGRNNFCELFTINSNLIKDMKIYPLKPGVLRYFGLPPKILLIMTSKLFQLRSHNTKKQILLVMKLVIIILFICLMQVSAAGLAQKVTFIQKSASLEQIFNQINKQTGYNVMWSSKKLDPERKINAAFKSANLEEVLSACLEGNALIYSIEDKNIVIKEKEPSFLDRVVGAFADINVIGVVVDGESGLALAGASVKVKGSGKATTTGGDGAFYLLGVDEQDVIVVSFIGYVTQDLKAKKDLGEIRLVIASSDLQEVTINKGYYSTTQELNTGGVSVVSSKDIEKQPVSDPLGALQGRVPGLFIEQTSGSPGRQFNVRLRGQNSLSNGNNPLFIVDGVPFNSSPLNVSVFGGGVSSSPLNSISPYDIETITVLKDADATAIYGSRGANGVILITTKKGQLGSTEFSINSYYGASRVAKRYDLLNTEEYLDMRTKAYQNDNLPVPSFVTTPTNTDYDVNGKWNKTKYTDWQEVMIGGTAKLTDLQGAFSGGSHSTQFRVGFGYRWEGNVFPGNNHMDKINVLSSINHRSSNNKFSLDFSGNYVVSENRIPMVDMMQYIFSAPNAPDIFNSEGNLNWENNTFQNPFSEILKKYNENTSNLSASSRLSYELLPGLKIHGSFGYNKNTLDQKRITPFTSANPFTTPNAQAARSIAQVNNFITSWLLEPQLSYSKSFWKGNFDVMVGTSFQETKQESIGQAASGFTDDEQIESIVAGTTKTISSYVPIQYRYNAIYGRIGYNIQDKYIVNVTGRRDGSSRFGPGKQFGNFGAFGAAWIFSKEKWFKDNQILSHGKLRASYGLTGNDQLGDYKYLSTYSFSANTYQGFTGLNPTQLTNPSYGWETVKKFEIGLETSYFQDRFSVGVSYYRNRTGNQLVGYNLPTTTGFSTVLANLPAVIQNTGIELEVNAQVINSKNFQWSTAFNISIPRNKLVSYPNIQSSSYSTRYAVGMPLSVSYLYTYTGINPATGLYTFLDKNSDGSLSATLDGSFIFTGQNYFGGFNNSFSYKNFHCELFFSYVKQTGQNLLYRGTIGAFGGSSSTGNQPRDVIVNSKNYQPFTTVGGPIFTNYGLFNSSDGRFTDASFIRLKNLKISYSLANELFSKVIKEGSIFLLGQNLLTITNYKGADPESRGELRLPPLRTIAIGLNAKF
jgi:TonB-linked SusC/RagA family outer membrane protein